MTEADELLDSSRAAATLRSAGLRLTPQRRAVVHALAGNRTHPTAEEVARCVNESLPGVSLSTIYNTLHEFAQVGLVTEIEAGRSLRFDAETDEHAHLICASCGTVTDVALERPLLEALSASAGTSIDAVTMYGVCGKCTH